MAEFFRIVYVNTRLGWPAGEQLPREIENLRDWSWLQSSLVRWQCIPFPTPGTTAIGRVLGSLSGAQLLILDWSSPNPGPARELYPELRRVLPKLPMFVVDYSTGREPTRDDYLSSDRFAVVVTEADLATPEGIERAFNRLATKLPMPTVTVDTGVTGGPVQTVLESLGENGGKKLALIVQKFFPDAVDAQVDPVGGGWSGARLVRLRVGGEQDPYFLKFFTSRKSYEDELRHHTDAGTWLDNAAVRIRLIPGFDDPVAQAEAFPTTTPCAFPVCYESASTDDCPRITLKEFYRTASGEQLERGVARLLAILSQRQPTERPANREPPWSTAGGLGFIVPREFKDSLLAALDDLSPYWEKTWGASSKARCDALQGIAYKPFPPWLTEWLPVVRGHIHGDPNPRNGLVARDAPEDLRLIDCGSYQSNGRLVSDLAIIERDIKLVMMGIEDQAHDFYDLDVGQLTHWYRAEEIAMGHGLNYKSDHVPDVGPGYCSAIRAHRLVGIVRQRARELCANWDSTGRHYFAALLYWTLEILRYPAVRPTKKLLALYSASQILLLPP